MSNVKPKLFGCADEAGLPVIDDRTEIRDWNTREQSKADPSRKQTYAKIKTANTHSTEPHHTASSYRTQQALGGHRQIEVPVRIHHSR